MSAAESLIFSATAELKKDVSKNERAGLAVEIVANYNLPSFAMESVLPGVEGGGRKKAARGRIS